MSDLAADLRVAVHEWRERGWPSPKMMVVTGSALGVELGACTHGPLPLAEVLPFPIHAVEGHALDLRILWPSEGVPVLYQRGRLHCYQGFDAHQVVFSVRLAALLGAEILLLTNAAGSLREERGPGSLCWITDHLNLSGLTPLRGELPAEWGERFPSMNGAYDGALRRIGHECAARLGISTWEGSYAWLLGPSYETPAEIRMLQRVGADLVGMSTVPEVLAARQLGVRCAALSLVTNLAAGLASSEPSHEDVVDEGRLAADDVARLLAEVLRQALVEPTPESKPEESTR